MKKAGTKVSTQVQPKPTTPTPEQSPQLVISEYLRLLEYLSLYISEDDPELTKEQFLLTVADRIFDDLVNNKEEGEK